MAKKSKDKRTEGWPKTTSKAVQKFISITGERERGRYFEEDITTKERGTIVRYVKKLQKMGIAPKSFHGDYERAYERLKGSEEKSLPKTSSKAVQAFMGKAENQRMKYFVEQTTGRERYSILRYVMKLHKEGFIKKTPLNEYQNVYNQLKSRAATKRKGVSSVMRTDKSEPMGQIVDFYTVIVKSNDRKIGDFGRYFTRGSAAASARKILTTMTEPLSELLPYEYIKEKKKLKLKPIKIKDGKKQITAGWTLEKNAAFNYLEKHYGKKMLKAEVYAFMKKESAAPLRKLNHTKSGKLQWNPRKRK